MPRWRRWISARAAVNSWFDHTLASRLNDKRRGAIVLVMQRLHEKDLAGYLLKKGGWRHLCLPAIAPHEEYIDFGTTRHHRREGAPLHADREPLELLERAQIELGSRAFAAQYQQAPASGEGAMLRLWWFKRYDAAPEIFDRIVQSWDTAIKSGDVHDASICITFGETQGVSFVLDVQAFRAEYPELRRAFSTLAAKFEPHAILIEDRASGQQLLQDAKLETTLPVIARNPKGDKTSRFASVSAMIEAGRVALPTRAPWLASFEKELVEFPGGDHDDQVDALTQYLEWARGSKINIGIRVL